MYNGARGQRLLHVVIGYSQFSRTVAPPPTTTPDAAVESSTHIVERRTGRGSQPLPLNCIQESRVEHAAAPPATSELANRPFAMSVLCCD